jgi:hypothetical protein
MRTTLSFRLPWAADIGRLADHPISLSNRTNEWVRLLVVVLSSEPNKVPIMGTDDHKVLADTWLP